MYCTQCGVQINAQDPYCSQCGAATGIRNTAAASPGSQPRLVRSIHDKKIAGVCGGLAQYLSLDSTLVRLVWLIATICFPPLLIGYFAAWIIMPREEPRLGTAFSHGVPEAHA